MEEWVDEGHSLSNVRHVRVAFLLPLALSLAVISVVVILVINNHRHEMIEHAVARNRTLISNLYHSMVQDHAETLGVAAGALEAEPRLSAAMAQGDRKALLHRARPLYEHLRRQYGVTHLYFVDPIGRVLLRMHDPQRYGDEIDRAVFRRADRTGHEVSGVELGRLGTLALRLVSPWRGVDGTGARSGPLLGYVEIGIDVDEIAQHIGGLVHGRLAVVVPKALLTRADWTAGARIVGYGSDWERFEHLVVAARDSRPFPGELERYLKHARLPDARTVLDIPGSAPGRRVLFVPVTDISGRHVADLVALMNISGMQQAAHRMVLTSGLTTIGVGLALFVFFAWLSTRLTRRLERDERRLNELATRDGLTGLYNHKMFHLVLPKEISRCARYGQPSALLMIDIDHFKAVNDRFGHPAGDRVLAELAARLRDALRAADSVFRYGGEEFVAILPVTGEAEACEAAERLRRTVAEAPFASGDGRRTDVTVSIGLAVCPPHAETEEALIAQADAALYAAKAAGRNRVCLCDQPLERRIASQPA